MDHDIFGEFSPWHLYRRFVIQPTAKDVHVGRIEPVIVRDILFILGPSMHHWGEDDVGEIVYAAVLPMEKHVVPQRGIPYGSCRAFCDVRFEYSKCSFMMMMDS